MLRIRQEQPVDLKLPFLCRILELQLPECMSEAKELGLPYGAEYGPYWPGMLYIPVYSFIITTATELFEDTAFKCLRQPVRNETPKKLDSLM